MKVMLVTGSITATTFENLNNVKPFVAASVYDVSTPELEKIAKIKALRAHFLGLVQGYEHLESVEDVPKPQKPEFSLEEMKDFERVQERVAQYEESMKEYEKKIAPIQANTALAMKIAYLDYKDIEAFSVDVDADVLNAVFNKINPKQRDVSAQRVHYYEVE